jgi:hypothetical protein
MDKQVLTEFRVFASQVQRLTENIYWVFATACTAPDSNARTYFLERFNKDFLDNAQRVVDTANAAGSFSITSPDALICIKKWLQNSCGATILTPDRNLALLLARQCAVSTEDENRKYVTKLLYPTKPPQGGLILDSVQTQRVEKLVRASTKFHLRNAIRSYKQEAVWGNMRIAGLAVLNPEKPTWKDLVHDMPQTIIQLAQNARLRRKTDGGRTVWSALSPPTCFCVDKKFESDYPNLDNDSDDDSKDDSKDDSEDDSDDDSDGKSDD